ncbi:hypothetical protein Tco_0968531 [Tanacetum coccineum]
MDSTTLSHNFGDVALLSGSLYWVFSISSHYKELTGYEVEIELVRGETNRGGRERSIRYIASIRGKKCVLISPSFLSFLPSSPFLSYGDELYGFYLWMTEEVPFDVIGFFFFFFFFFSDSHLLLLLLLLLLLWSYITFSKSAYNTDVGLGEADLETSTKRSR